MRKLYTSSRDRKIFGVCGGLAEYFGVDATLLRILLIVVAVFSAGSVVLVYILAGFIIPREPSIGGFGSGPFGGEPVPPRRWSGGYNGWTPPQQTPTWTPGTPWPGPSSAHTGSTGPARPGPAPSQAAPASAAAPELDAMMDDIEKKALKREIEELKARISKFEQQSKGE
ncbi:PspC domain-containing protein [Cohnella thermotolerans]|jgi:phage shock protein C|uniref:PspC domain-containing protein n=1 Tax=Cohnella thermotolerans TaxID=329858 RepID=UPI000405506F|nr:PspC domain-containing protein [Cohnella thermotolerans]